MNDKMDILDAWITIEQLSEGSIKKNDKQLRALNRLIENKFYALFKSFLDKQKFEQKVSNIDFKKSGIVFYFDIFNFQEIVTILRKKYGISATDEETNNSEKFTFAIYFDNNMNFISEKLFFTISGYIRYKNELPKDFAKAENSLRDDLSKQFEDKEFDAVMTDLLKQYKVSLEDCRYGFVRDLENSDINLHSFFIDDLQKAKSLKTDNMKRYLYGFSGNRQNLDSKSDSQNFDPEIFQEILQPKFYPLGRFPSNPDFSLSFMQEVTVNLALNEKNNIRSVNGPPGTGKTTLLKDIFAELVVQQAIEICELFDKQIKGSLIYYEKAKIGVLPSQIADKNSVVASSNNGAVQNIVNELPQMNQISEEFREKLIEADYFKTIANSELGFKWAKKGDKNFKELSSEIVEDTNWGTFSLEGGAATNINKMLLNVEFIEQYLKDEYEPNHSVYQDFSKLHKEVLNQRYKLQQYYEQICRLQSLNTKYEKEKNVFVKEKIRKQNELDEFKQKSDIQQGILLNEKKKFETELGIIISEITTISQDFSLLQRNYELIKSQKPTFLGFKKIFSKTKVSIYFEKLNDVNEKMNAYVEKNKALLANKGKIEQQIRNSIDTCTSIQTVVKVESSKFDNWVNIQSNTIDNLRQKINSLGELKRKSNIDELDFSKSYESLQKSNPWFTKNDRIKQSELFISALKVRKQFLYENRKNLTAAKNIWSHQSVNISKENGQQLLTESWQWLNFVIPLVSTTFASFGRMFRNIPENTIGNLFIDEAGQALPQASIGAIFRSKKIMVVGDPSQIKPVLTLDSNILNLIGQNYQVNEKFVSAEASTQTLVDATSQYGFQKSEDEWIGIPLWVHRRSNYPMFTISNELSYGGLMVHGKSEDESQGKSEWFDVSGKANDKFVREQADFLKIKINERVDANRELKDKIYVISPFKNVAYNLSLALDSIGFTKREKGKAINVGTVHTFQGKEAEIVYFVLGADTSSQGAARWAVSDSNMMNVAATRAKSEFYVIGDKSLYASLGSKVANMTLSIIEDYNR